MFEIKQKQKADQSGKRDNITGIPVQMKAYAENLYGSSLDHVRVHYQSEKPRQFHALGYTQGTDVYLGPGQEKHLMHELCHVIQQKKGVVKPTSIEGGHAINDSMSLEKEAEAFEKQYEKEAPMQMLRDKAAERSEAMGLPGLDPRYSDKYHVLGNFVITDGQVTMQVDGTVWSYKPSYMNTKWDPESKTTMTTRLMAKSEEEEEVEAGEKEVKAGEEEEKEEVKEDDNGGDHAEDAICEIIECLYWINRDATAEGKPEAFPLEGAKAEIVLSASPCKRCQERLKKITDDYGVRISVTCAHQYSGKKGSGAGDTSELDGDSKLTIQVLEDPVEQEKLLQF